MSQVKAIFNNTSWMSVSQIVASVCAFLWTIIIARYLGVSDYGIVSFAISFTTLMDIFLDFGISTYITREISKNRDAVYKIVDNLFFFKIFLSIVLFFVSGLILYLLGYSVLTIIVTLIFNIEVIFISMAYFLNGVFQAFEKTKYQAIANILNSSLLLIGVLLIVGFDLGVVSVAIAYAIGYFVYFAYMFLAYLRKFGYPKLEIDLSFIKTVLINAIPFGLTSFFYNIYFTIDIVMLSYLTGDYSTGLYKSAYNIINIFTSFFIVYQSVIFPVMSKFFKESQDLIKVSYELSVKYLLLIILPITVGIFLYSRPIMDLIYNNKYFLASSTVQILIWTVCFLFVNGAASILLNAIDKERIVTKIYIFVALMNVILNLILIPYFSYNGAAFATVISEILITILTLYYIFKTKYAPGKSLLKNIIKLFVSTIILAIFLNYINVSLWLAIPIGLVVYVTLLLITQSVDETDKYILNELIR